MEFLILLLLIVLNGVFSMSEMAIVSSRKARLQQLADEGKGGARIALTLANNPGTFLSTIQVGITVIGITSGAFGEATLASGLAQKLSALPQLAPYANGLAIAIVVVSITLASLMLGELIPKRLALLRPEAVASIVAGPMAMLAKIAHPLVSLLSAITDGVVRVFTGRHLAEPPVSEEEINVLMNQGAAAGVFEPHEKLLVSRVFKLDELKVTGVMTPRADIVFLDLEAPEDVNFARITAAAHSRFPVVRGGLEKIEGVVEAKSLLKGICEAKILGLAAHLVKPLYVPHSLPVMDVIEHFKKHRQTMALVVDEFGEILGLVTLNDVMEAFVGDVATSDSEADLDIKRRDDGSWLVDGSVFVERFKDVLGIDRPLPEEASGLYQTVGGFAMMRLERVPQVTDRFQWEDLEFEVIDMDGNRVDKLIVKRFVAH